MRFKTKALAKQKWANCLKCGWLVDVDIDEYHRLWYPAGHFQPLT
jgi:hypothetical protein